MRVITKPFKWFAAAVRAVPWRQTLRDYAFMTIGALLIGFSINIFLVPAKIPNGSLLSIGMIGERFLGLPIGLTMLALRVPGLILGFRYLGRRRFLFRTGWVAAIMTAAIDLLAPYLGAVTDNQLLNMLYGAIMSGVGGGIIYLGGGTTGGTGVIARVIQRFKGMPLSQIYILIDGTAVALAGYVFGWEAALLGILAIFINGMVADYTMEGPSVIRTATIVTDQSEQISAAILQRLRRGVTAWGAEGMYTRMSHTILFCTVSRPEVHTLRQLVLEVDPQAFIVIGQAHQSTGGMVRDQARRAARSG